MNCYCVELKGELAERLGIGMELVLFATRKYPVGYEIHGTMRRKTYYNSLNSGASSKISTAVSTPLSNNVRNLVEEYLEIIK